MSAVSHSRHVCCVTQPTCLLRHNKHVCFVAQRTSLLRTTADMSAVSQSTYVCCVAQQTCLRCHTAHMSAVTHPFRWPAVLTKYRVSQYIVRKKLGPAVAAICIEATRDQLGDGNSSFIIIIKVSKLTLGHRSGETLPPTMRLGHGQGPNGHCGV